MHCLHRLIIARLRQQRRSDCVVRDCCGHSPPLPRQGIVLYINAWEGSKTKGSHVGARWDKKRKVTIKDLGSMVLPASPLPTSGYDRPRNMRPCTRSRQSPRQRAQCCGYLHMECAAGSGCRLRRVSRPQAAPFGRLAARDGVYPVSIAASAPNKAQSKVVTFGCKVKVQAKDRRRERVEGACSD